MKRFLPLLAVILLPLALSACATHLDKKEGYLREAGFRTVKPSTPDQIARFQSMRKGHITHETRNGQTMFMLADDRNNTLLVGSETEFQNYQEILYAKSVNPDTASAKFSQGLETAWNEGWGSVLGSLVPQ
jgi:hypothetical protein